MENKGQRIHSSFSIIQYKFTILISPTESTCIFFSSPLASLKPVTIFAAA